MLIKRDIFGRLLSHLSKKEISLIVGPRQAGKTTIMKALQQYLEQKGERTLYMSLDFDRDRPFFESQDRFVERLRLEFGTSRGYVFIDEIQRRPEAGLFLKGLYDMDLPQKLIVSGSGSLELKEKIHESLLGRKRLFELYTLSFSEFLNFRTEYKYEGRLKEFFRLFPARAEMLFMEYINFGGYPRVALESKLEEKEALIDEIFRTYLEKDISFLLRVERAEVFRDMFRLLGAQVGQPVSFTSLSQDTGASIQTIKNYLYFAERTFMIKRVPPFYRNISKEIRKSPLIYFTDLGLRNYAIGMFGRYQSTEQLGFVFQNFVLRLLMDNPETSKYDIRYWRTKNRAEVDFVLIGPERVIPVECKCQRLKQPKLTRALKSFIASYRPKEAWIVNLTLQQEVMVEETKVRFMPFWELLG